MTAVPHASKPLASGHAESADTLTVRALLWLIIAVVLLRLLTLGLYPLLDTTEARYALIGVLMQAAGDWVTPLIAPGVPFWAKPPLSFWLTLLSYDAFGISEFTARLPSFLVTLLTAVLVYRLGIDGRDRRFGLLTTAVFLTMGLPFYLAGGVMTDPALELTVTLMMAAFWLAIRGPNLAWGYLFFVGAGLTMLAKGPVGIVLAGLGIFPWVVWQRQWGPLWRSLPWVVGTLLTLVIFVPWYWLAEQRTPGFLQYFIIGEHIQRFLQPGWTGDLYGAGRAHPIGTIWLFMLLACLPWSGLLIAVAFDRRHRPAYRRIAFLRDPWMSYLFFWCLAPLLLFTFARNILITYTATALPAFALITAHVLRGALLERRRLVVTLACLVPVGMTILVILMRIAPDSPLVPSQKQIVAAYEQRRAAGDRLVYFGNLPLSVRFYSRDQAKLARTPAEIEQLLAEGGGVFVAVRAKQLENLPQALRERLETVATGNGTVLMRARRG